MENKILKNKQGNEIEFACKASKQIFSGESYRIYAVDVDTKKHPDVILNNYGNATIAGNIHELGVGITYKVKAVAEQSKYGLSYKVLNIKRDRPNNHESTKEFLREILTEQQADELLREYPTIVTKVINDDLEDIDLSKLFNIGKVRFEKIKERIIENFALVDLVEKFQGTITLSMIKALYLKYPSMDKLMIELQKEPYKCLCGINRVGFKTADAILAEIEKISAENIKNGKEPIIDFGYDLLTSSQRCKACVMFLLEENETSGNTYMEINELKKQSDKLAPACKEHFVEIIKHKDDIYFEASLMAVSLTHTFNMEKYIADKINDNQTYIANEKTVSTDNNNAPKLEWNINYGKYVEEFKLTEEQGKALEYMCKYNLFILNGFGGSGKSYTSSAVIKMLTDSKKRIQLLAPTGRASKILAEYAKYPASTIHRGLGYKPPKWEFCEDNLLSCDVLIMDETSMTDVSLMEKVFKAVNLKKTKLMFIGDSAQLPSVGAGNVLHDFITSNAIPIVTLTKIFRYGVGGVLTVATKIRNQERFITSNKQPTIIGEDRGYIFFPTEQNIILARVKQLYEKLINDGKKPEDIMVLSAYNKGDYGTIAINNLLQPIANKNFGDKNKFDMGTTVFYIGDLVMQTVNNYKAKKYIGDRFDDGNEITTFIPNGELGTIDDINIYKEQMIQSFDNEKIKYSKSEANMLKLAYSIGIHKSQGGSADTVILITPKAHTYMLNSNIMYVGVTRARSCCYHFGDVDTVNLALTKKENFNRKTLLKHFINTKK